MREKSDRHIRVRVSADEYTFVREILQKKKAGGKLPTIVYASAKMTNDFTFRLRWAQSVNNTTTATVHKGSQLLIWEVA